MTGHHQNGDYLEILLAGRIIKMDDSTTNKWQAISRKNVNPGKSNGADWLG